MDNLPPKEYLAIGGLVGVALVWTYMSDEYKLYLFPSMIDKNGQAVPPDEPVVQTTPNLEAFNQQIAATAQQAGPFRSTIGL